MLKMALHRPFGHLQHKLWQKERPGVKLPVWLPTIKSRESNYQFDSRPLKVGNRPNPNACRWSATHRWKTLEESYKFALDLILIRGLSKELRSLKVPKVQTEIVSRLLLGSPGTKSHSDVGAAERHRIYYMGESGSFLWGFLVQFHH